MSTKTIDTLPRVWISSFGAYNAGFLIGKWVDAADADDVTARDLFTGSPYRWSEDEELWCFDIENIPVRREMSPHEATEWGEVLASVDEHLRPALHAWVESGSYVAEGTGDLPSIPDFEERYCGEWDSFREYAEQLGEDIGLLAGVPEEVARYFAWDRWTRDLAYDYTVVDAEHSGVFVFRDL